MESWRLGKSWGSAMTTLPKNYLLLLNVFKLLHHVDKIRWCARGKPIVVH